MLDQFLIFLPSAFALLWAIMFLFFGCRNGRSLSFEILMLLVVVYCFCDSCYASARSSISTLSVTNILIQLVTPCVIPLIWYYLSKLSGLKTPTVFQTMWISLPVFLFTVTIVFYALIGKESMASCLQYFEDFGTYPADNELFGFFQFFTNYIFRIILTLELFALIIAMIISMRRTEFSLKTVFNFCFKGGSAKPIDLQHFNLMIFMIVYVCKVVIQRSVFIAYPSLAIVLALLICTLLCTTGIVALFHNEDSLTYSRMVRAFDFNKEEYLSFEKRPEKEKVAEGLGGSSDASSASLLERFEDLIINQQLYLTQGITINDIARQLGSNKTYISRLVNSTYNLSFPDYINNLRIDYAEQYLLHNSDAHQSEIAEACGFPSASAFNNTFKKITGVTPRIWLVTNKKKD